MSDVSNMLGVIFCAWAQVVALPSQTCAYKVKITETSSVVRADSVAMRGCQFYFDLCRYCLHYYMWYVENWQSLGCQRFLIDPFNSFVVNVLS